MHKYLYIHVKKFEVIVHRGPPLLSFLQVAHESWQLSLSHYLSVRGNLLTLWAQNKTELGSKVTSLFAEVTRVSEAKEMARAEREERRKRCHKLYQRVSLVS